MKNNEKRYCESNTEAKATTISALAKKEFGGYNYVCTADGIIPKSNILDVARRDSTVSKLLEAAKASDEASEYTAPVWFTKSVRTVIRGYDEVDDGFEYVYECLAAEPDMREALLWLFERSWDKKAGPQPAFCLNCSEGIPRNGKPFVRCPKCGQIARISDVLFIDTSDALHEVMQVLMLTKRIQELIDADDWDTAENTLFVLPSLCCESALWVLSLLNDFIDHCDIEGHCLSLCSLPDICLDREYIKLNGFCLKMKGLPLRPDRCHNDLVKGDRLFSFFLPLAEKLGGSDILFRMLLPLRANQLDMMNDTPITDKDMEGNNNAE